MWGVDFNLLLIDWLAQALLIHLVSQSQQHVLQKGAVRGISEYLAKLPAEDLYR